MTAKTREVRDEAILAATAICEDIAENGGSAKDCVSALHRFSDRLETAPAIDRLDVTFEQKVIRNAMREAH